MGTLESMVGSFARNFLEGLRVTSPFQHFVREGLGQLGLEPDRESERTIILNAQIDHSRLFKLVCQAHWPLMDVCVLSGLSFPLNEVPAPISYALLRRNHQLPVGAWRLIAADHESSAVCGHVIDSRFHTPVHLALTIEQLYAETEKLRRLIG